MLYIAAPHRESYIYTCRISADESEQEITSMREVVTPFPWQAFLSTLRSCAERLGQTVVILLFT